VVVLFALLLPVIMGLGSVVLAAGNWFVHKKHLQTLVDAGALAGGGAFTGCAQDSVQTNNAIRDTALAYSGDKNRDPLSRNTQVQQAGDVHVVLNSTQYWSTGSPTDGSGFDNTLDSADVDAQGDPCNERYLDVKATDEDAPLIWRWLPATPSPKAKATVEIRDVASAIGVLPFAVPELDAERVAVIFIDENVSENNSASVVGAGFLNEQTNLAPNDPLRAFSTWRGDVAPVDLNGSENFNVVVAISFGPTFALSGSLRTICGRTGVTCYGGDDTNSSGLSHIHTYSGSGSGSADDPILRDVDLSGGCSSDLSAPYFNFNAGCPIHMSAEIDFGSSDPDEFPTCAVVTAPGFGQLAYSSGRWVSTSPYTPAPGTGGVNNEIEIQWESGDEVPRRNDTENCTDGTTDDGDFPKVAKPYAADLASGPVEYVQLELTTSPGGLANSMEGNSTAGVRATVGLQSPLSDRAPTDPPIRLRYASDSGSQNQAVDCDKTENFRTEILDNCKNPYSRNVRGGSCSGYGPGNLPQRPVAPLPGDDCVAVEPGDKTGQLRQAITERWGDPDGNGPLPCDTLNHWPTTPGGALPPLSDPRYVTLFITDYGTFQGGGVDIYPIRRFAVFYMTAADGLNCPGDVPANPGPKNVWGYWMTYVVPNPGGIPSGTLCPQNNASLCYAVLVE
jgi:hypothetical protein